MERSEILDLMKELQLAGMRAAYDEIVTAGVKRNQGIERVIGALLQAEIAAKHARSINYQMGLAKLPLVKELADLDFEGSPVNGELVESLASGTFLDTQRNVVLIGGTGTGKSHIAIGVARNCIRQGHKARFFNVVDLVNKLESEVKLGRQGRIADSLVRADLVVMDELGYLPFAQSGGQLLFHLISRLYERTSIIVTTNLAFAVISPQRAAMTDDRYPHDWVSSDDCAERFCALCQMMPRNIRTARDLANSVAWIAAYRRAFYADLKHLGHRIH